MLDITPINIRTWSMLGSCGAFGIAANELPSVDDRVVMLTSDLCFYSGLERFGKNFPDRMYNVGIAEQNMVGVAAGFAKEGFIPFATTYGTFASMRCADQVRVNMGYMNCNIKLVGMTSGLSVGILGATHISIEDMAVMRAIPNIVILSPADCTETVKATIAAAKYNGPVYLRLTGTMNNPPVYKGDYDFEIGKAITMLDGSDIAIIATGTMVHKALAAAKLLAQNGVSAKVVNMHTIKPLDREAVAQCASLPLVVTLEEHSIHGGLGSAVAEELAQRREKPVQLILGINDYYEHANDYNVMLGKYGLLHEQIADKILNKYKEIK